MGSYFSAPSPPSPKPRTTQTARRGGHQQYVAREGKDDERHLKVVAGYRSKQTARRGDNLGFLARAASRSTKENDKHLIVSKSSSKQSERTCERGTQTARRGGHSRVSARVARKMEQEQDHDYSVFLHGENGEEDEEDDTTYEYPAREDEDVGIYECQDIDDIKFKVDEEELRKETEDLLRAWGDQNIIGDWAIKFESTNSSWLTPLNHLTMTVSRDTDRPGDYMATFDFKIMEGIMRISCLMPTDDSEQHLMGSYMYRAIETSQTGKQIRVESDLDDEGFPITFSCGRAASRLGGGIRIVGLGWVGLTGSRVRDASEQEGSSTELWESFSEEGHELVTVEQWD
ncbi:hypothetical protein CKM354_000494300 [Cercospora kikuchii]|uniref:Uncharacterized protein n=1 Tax=Cercospora kikuchii TaxID=84275 RepID=A0A9P3CEW1_9PEZI|nr:uncharacterized protein CKM354_000494300 [Cercospora kikuchii]GIZ41644.1 hypothetical protein CKM354_000494300 [Cercospora kikuchii]